MVLAARTEIENAARHWLAVAGTKVASAVRIGKIAKAGADDEHDDAAAAQAADALDYAELGTAIEPQVATVATNGAAVALHQVTDPLDEMLSQANAQAVEWARARSAELVTQVSETTRAAVRGLVSQAEDEGWSNDKLADALEDDEAFASSRAEMIARTETAFADVQGNLIGWSESGVVAGKRWVLAQDQYCDDCAALDGVEVGLDEDFPDDGGDGPPLHPNCRCDVLPVLGGDEEPPAD